MIKVTNILFYQYKYVSKSYYYTHSFRDIFISLKNISSIVASAIGNQKKKSNNKGTNVNKDGDGDWVGSHHLVNGTNENKIKEEDAAINWMSRFSSQKNTAYKNPNNQFWFITVKKRQNIFYFLNKII